MASWTSLVSALLLASAVIAAPGQEIQLDAASGRAAKREISVRSQPAALDKVLAKVETHLTSVPANAHGSVWLSVRAEWNAPAGAAGVPVAVDLRIPLSSTEDVYGESRSCHVRSDGRKEFVFTAGMDEASFLPFATAKDGRQLTFLLNKYLCRALASSFDCSGHKVNLPKAWAGWRFVDHDQVELNSDVLATLSLGYAQVQSSGQSFDPSQCAVIAPSNGVCCVGGKTTQWHCGGKPPGDGWHQVSGDCFHHETGGTCKE